MAQSPVDRARERAVISAKLIEMQKRRNAACEQIADALTDIARLDTVADVLLDDLGKLNAKHPGLLSAE